MSKIAELAVPDSSIGPYSFEEFLEVATAFHGNPAPGLILGAYMVEAARLALPEGILFDAVVETQKCLPDAVQLLTPPSYGNGWLRVVNLGRYALSLYDKRTGEGVRVWLDPDHLRNWPEIHDWYLKARAKKDQDRDRLFAEIKAAARAVCRVAPVRLRPDFLARSHMGAIGLCPVCGEGYPTADGAICRGCAGEAPYLLEYREPLLRAVQLGEPAGLRSRSATPACGHGERPAGDVPDALRPCEAGSIVASAMVGPGIIVSDISREGAVEFLAETGGLLTVARQRLTAFNLLEGFVCASRQSHLLVEAGKSVAGLRVLSAAVSRPRLDTALALLAEGPLFAIHSLRHARVGVLVTGVVSPPDASTDRVEPVVRAKVGALGSSVVAVQKAAADRTGVAAAVSRLLAAGVDLIVTTAGLSADPDEPTRLGLGDAGLVDARFGVPVLPGARVLLGRIGPVDVVGLPSRALLHHASSLDLLLPRVLAGVGFSRRDLAELADGALCLFCRSCTFPKCPFGK